MYILVDTKARSSLDTKNQISELPVIQTEIFIGMSFNFLYYQLFPILSILLQNKLSHDRHLPVSGVSQKTVVFVKQLKQNVIVLKTNNIMSSCRKCIENLHINYKWCKPCQIDKLDQQE